MYSQEIKIMLYALSSQIEGYTQSAVQSSKLCPAKAKKRPLLCHWRRVIFESLICVLLYIYLNSSKKAAKTLISYRAQSGSCLGSTALLDSC